MKYYKPIAIILILVSIFALSFSSCEKVKDLASFDITYPLPKIRFSLDSATYQPKTEMLLYQGSISINLDSIIDAYKLDGIENAKFESVVLEIELPTSDQANFNWLSSIRMSVGATDMSETEIASLRDIPANLRVLEMETTGADITPIIKQKIFNYKIYGSIVPPLPVQSLELVLKSSIKLRVRPL